MMTDERLAELRVYSEQEENAAYAYELKELIAEIDRLRGLPVAKCARCPKPLGAKHYSAVPGVGDLCLDCHAIYVPR